MAGRRCCISVGTADALPRALVVFRGLENNLDTIRQLGYQGIELGLRDAALDVAATRSALETHDLECPVISTGQMFPQFGASFMTADRGARRRLLDECLRIVDIAAELGADMGINRLRGTVPPEMEASVALDLLTEALQEISAHAAPVGVRVLIEQLNRYEVNYLVTLPALADFVRSTGIPNLCVHADTHHMNIEEANVAEAVAKNADVLGYVHLSDSNRGAPGDGHVDFPAFFAALDRISYDGWIGVEIEPRPSPEEAARRAMKYLQEVWRGVAVRNGLPAGGP